MRSPFSFKMVFLQLLFYCAPFSVLYMRFLRYFNLYHSSQRKLLVSRQYRHIDKSGRFCFCFKANHSMHLISFPGEYRKRMVTLFTCLSFSIVEDPISISIPKKPNKEPASPISRDSPHFIT